MIVMLTSRLSRSPGAPRRPSIAASTAIVDAISSLSLWLQHFWQPCRPRRRPPRRPQCRSQLLSLVAIHTTVPSVPNSHGRHPRPSGAATYTTWVALARSLQQRLQCRCRQQILTIARRAFPTGRPVGLPPRSLGAVRFTARVAQAAAVQGARRRPPSTARRALEIGSRGGPSRRRIGVARTKVKGARPVARMAFFDVQVLPTTRSSSKSKPLLDSLREYQDLCSIRSNRSNTS